MLAGSNGTKRATSRSSRSYKRPDQSRADAVGRYMKKKALPFPSIVDERESPMFTNYGVTGIPQSVLIDRKESSGCCRSGTPEGGFTKALREKIVELLAE